MPTPPVPATASSGSKTAASSRRDARRSCCGIPGPGSPAGWRTRTPARPEEKLDSAMNGQNPRSAIRTGPWPAATPRCLAFPGCWTTPACPNCSARPSASPASATSRAPPCWWRSAGSATAASTTAGPIPWPPRPPSCSGAKAPHGPAAGTCASSGPIRCRTDAGGGGRRGGRLGPVQEPHVAARARRRTAGLHPAGSGLLGGSSVLRYKPERRLVLFAHEASTAVVIKTAAKPAGAGQQTHFLERLEPPRGPASSPNWGTRNAWTTASAPASPGAAVTSRGSTTIPSAFAAGEALARLHGIAGPGLAGRSCEAGAGHHRAAAGHPQHGFLPAACTGGTRQAHRSRTRPAAAGPRTAGPGPGARRLLARPSTGGGFGGAPHRLRPGARRDGRGRPGIVRRGGRDGVLRRVRREHLPGGPRRHGSSKATARRADGSRNPGWMSGRPSGSSTAALTPSATGPRNGQQTCPGISAGQRS